MSVIKLLRNRVYIGQVYLRGTHHDAPHPPLVDWGAPILPDCGSSKIPLWKEG